MMNFTKGSLGICFSLLLLAGCSSSDVEITSYKESGVNEDFPVPSKAKVSEVQFNNPHIKKGEKYTLRNIGGKQGLYPPADYFEQISLEGWEELKEERMGHVHFFQKEDTVISLVIKEDYFELFEMKEGYFEEEME